MAESTREILGIVFEALDAKLMLERTAQPARGKVVSCWMDFLSEMTPGISPMTAWNIAKEAGEETRIEGQRLRERVSE